MYVDLFLWDEEDDPKGNVQHIAAADITPEEVEEVVRNHTGPMDVSKRSGNPLVRGTTSTGQHMAVAFQIEPDPELIIIRPITAYPVPE
jgi:hypothetical protein